MPVQRFWKEIEERDRIRNHFKFVLIELLRHFDIHLEWYRPIKRYIHEPNSDLPIKQHDHVPALI